ncbi:protein-lysine N-methyltransferase rrg1-like [Teratosphaeria destructans]|uniref:Protein-lysine N-methyltransferase rrg1-like n=1 Tax=Teratosphaeria destructans TaxID=418781 RepID=A0A9W7W2V4_9PEZI|nr:protein-lysine N-methyltransferase rrg1-like [Teratosphaeria destructans]
MSTRTRLSFNVQVDHSHQTTTLTIADPSHISADNLALSTWGSSEILANTLHKIDVDLPETNDMENLLPVLELGAGTGLVGMTAAAAWKTTAVLTDLPPILPNIEANVHLNRAVISQYGGHVRYGTLDWFHPDRLTFGRDPSGGEVDSSQARVILAADTVYSEEHPELLVNVIKCRLEPGQRSRLIICYPLRIGYLDHIRDLWQRLEDADLTCIEEGREHLDQEWEEDVEYEWCVWKWQSAS